ncbi:alpha-2-macroglobulin-like [Protopterus annectens]|uniref:alpha-2-macroglobulin-like n=1 Tax=Protopterus annectens TaxID=7888 RepID=UPI001CFA6D24|nr:alpha-2-macroglobulin-like [Protopterus annectens]
MLEETDIKDILEEVTPVVEKIRKYFPETWIWDLISVGSSGDVFVPVNVPDTITEWKAGMFCMANTGFGLAKTVGLNVFQPFFLEPILPYSVIRGEEFPLKVTVFNYLQQCIKVQVTLEKSEDFEISSCERCEYSSCICGGRTKAFVWNIVPITLGNVNFTITAEAIQTNELCYNEVVIVPTRGRKDTVIKPLLVEPEGTKMEMAKSSLLCPKGPTLLENISVQLPSEVVKGSARAYVSVVGDIMGNALQNLDNLLAMPYGCGEQNMVLFAPNIFILQYLEKTGQLTAAIKEKAIRFLESGYQRELLYKHNDGSYSAFGHIDPTGNTWLTAFVLKSFAQAKPYIFVDDTHINNAAGWLRRLQLQNGCFRSVGHLFHSSMKGGVNDDISLAAYIVAALLELQTEHPGNTVTKGLKCLHAAAPNITNPYTLAVMAYTYSLAGRMKERRILLNHLYSIAIEKDDTLHWEEAKKATKIYNPYIWYQAPSTEVEMAAYVLLALVSVPNPSSDDIISASKIVKWITKQQGPHGGFSSTQDTVVALQALSKYGGLTYSEKGHITIKIKSKENLVGHFEVNKDNRLLLQRIALTDIPRNYTAEINGEGCILFQTMLKYNIPPPKNVPVFSIQVETARSTCIESSMTRFEVLISVSYTGKRVVSNMAIIEVKMLSGYIPDKKSVQMLQQSSHLVKKTEVQTNHVLLYLEELSHNASKFAFYVEQEVVVKNLKPAVVKIYDYYEKDEHAITQYVDPCVAEAEKESNTR